MMNMIMCMTNDDGYTKTTISHACMMLHKTLTCINSDLNTLDVRCGTGYLKYEAHLKVKVSMRYEELILVIRWSRDQRQGAVGNEVMHK